MIVQNPPVDPNRHVIHFYSYDRRLNRVATCIDCGMTRQVSRKGRTWYIYPDGRVSSNEPSCKVILHALKPSKKDAFADLKPPRSPEKLAQLRLETLNMEDGQGHRVFDPETVFTCDDCGHAPVCVLVFDGYNTDGDCLASK